jgi:hypothetical protein
VKTGKRTRTEKTPLLTLALMRRMERTPSAPGCVSITTEEHVAVPASVTIRPFGATGGVTVRVGTAVASAPAVVENTTETISDTTPKKMILRKKQRTLTTDRYQRRGTYWHRSRSSERAPDRSSGRLPAAAIRAEACQDH